MPLRIRCPHCRNAVSVPDDSAGESVPCPACRQTVLVPIPEREIAVAVPTVRTCPHCRAELSPTSTVCQRCFLDLRTKRRVSFSRRLRLGSRGAWAVLLSALALLAAAATTSVVLVQRHFDRLAREAHAAGLAADLRARTPTPPDAISLSSRLLASPGPREREQAARELRLAGPAAMPALSRQLAGAAREGAERVRVENQLSAIDVLSAVLGEARSADAPAGVVREVLSDLANLDSSPQLASAALRARALLGDARAAAPLSVRWQAALRNALLLERVAELTTAPPESPFRRIASQHWQQAERLADGLRQLVHSPESRVLDEILPDYWESWRWLGQVRAERFATELFELAQPGRRDGGARLNPSDETRAEIRAARDALKFAAQRAAPTARCAAGMVLLQLAPNYQSARERILAALAEMLTECAPGDQQVVAWTIARLSGRSFEQFPADASPLDVRRDDVAALLQWIRSAGIARPGVLTARSAAYPAPPALTLHVVPALRQIELDLLTRMQRDFSDAAEAASAWRKAGLGATPRLRALLDPGQHAPYLPALAAALVLAGASGDQSLRRELELWRLAREQPAWVRELAYMALGALDAQRGRWDSGWPEGLDLSAAADPAGPGWEAFGQALAAGGASMRARLEDRGGPMLSDGRRAKLFRAAQRAADALVDDRGE